MNALTKEQFEALSAWIVAEIEAAQCSKSAGPHVAPIQRKAKETKVFAFDLLTTLRADPL